MGLKFFFGLLFTTTSAMLLEQDAHQIAAQLALKPLTAKPSFFEMMGAPQPDAFCKAANDKGAFPPAKQLPDPIAADCSGPDYQKIIDAYGIIKKNADDHSAAFATNMKAVAAALTGTPVFGLAPLKQRPRSWQKVGDAAKYNGNWCKLTDVVRGSIIFNSVNDLADAVGGNFANFKAKLTANCAGCSIVDGSIKNRFKTPSVGYRDFMMLIKTGADNYQAEVQLHIDEMIKSKHDGGHKLYRAHRELAKKNKEDYENLIITGVDIVVANGKLEDNVWAKLEADKTFMKKLDDYLGGKLKESDIEADMQKHYDNAWNDYIGTDAAKKSAKTIVEGA